MHSLADQETVLREAEWVAFAIKRAAVALLHNAGHLTTTLTDAADRGEEDVPLVIVDGQNIELHPRRAAGRLDRVEWVTRSRMADDDVEELFQGSVEGAVACAIGALAREQACRLVWEPTFNRKQR